MSTKELFSIRFRLFFVLSVLAGWGFLINPAVGGNIYWTGDVDSNWSSGNNWEHYSYGAYRYYGQHPQNDDMIYFQAREGNVPSNYTHTNINYAGQHIFRLIIDLDNVGIYGQAITVDGGVNLNEGLHAIIDNDIILGNPDPNSGAGGPSFWADSNAVLTLSGNISGNHNLEMIGQGTVRLQGTNTFVGTISSLGGIIEFSSNANLGAATCGLKLGYGNDLGTLRYTSSGTATINRSLEVGRMGGGGGCFDLPNAGTVLTWSGAVAGEGGTLKKTGPGKLVLSGANTFEASMEIEEGTLAVASEGSLGSHYEITIRGGGTFQNQNLINYGGSFRIGSGGATISTLGDLTVNGGIGAEYGAVNPTLTKADSYTLTTPSLLIPTTINNGVLRYTGHGLGVDINNLSTLELAPDASMTYNGTISGSGLLHKSGTQTVTLAGTRTGLGRTAITGGLIEVSADSKLGSAPGNFVANQLELNGGGLKTTASFTLAANRGITLGAGNGTLSVDPNTTLTAGGPIAGTGNLTKTGTGILVLNANNTFTGDLQITQGTVRCGPVNALGDSTVVTIDQNATLDLNGNTQWFGGIAGAGNIPLGAGELKTQGSRDTVFSGSISGSGRLVKDGTHTLTLSGINTYTGLTRVSHGVLRLEDGNAISNNASIVMDNAVGVRLELGANEEIGQISGGGSLVNVDLGGYRMTLGGSNIDTTFSGYFMNGGLTKEGSGTFTLNQVSSLNELLISEGTLKSNAGYLSGNPIIQSKGTLELNQTTEQTFYDDISGGGTLLKTGAGKLTLQGINTHSGLTKIQEGPVKVMGGNAIGDLSAVEINSPVGTFLELGASEEIGSLLGGGEVVLNGYALTVGGNNQNTIFDGLIGGVGGRLVKKGTGTLTLTESCSYTGGTTVEAGRLKGYDHTLQGNIANNAIVEFNQTSAGTYSGIMTGTGQLIKTGAGMLTLEGDSTYTGETHIQEGILRLGTGNILGQTTVQVDAGATLDLYDTDESIGALTGEGNVTLGMGILGVYKDGDYTFAGVISGTGKLSKEGPGTFELLGTNTYSGGTSITKGILKGNTNSLQGDIANSASVIFNQATEGTYAGKMSGTGSLIKQNSGTLILTGSNTSSGNTTISQGTLQIGNGGTTGSIGGSITNNANLTFNRNNIYTFNGMISGTGSVTQNGTGTTNLGGANTYTGGTTVTAGVLGIANDGNLGGTSGSLTLNGGTLKSAAAFSFNSARSIILGNNDGTFDTNNYDTTVPSVVSGTGTLTKAGLARLILTGANSYSGGTTISQGTLQIGNGGTIGSIAGSVTNNADLAFNRSDDVIFSGTISGTGTVTQNGSGTLTLSGSNSYTGGTMINAGIVNVNANANLGSSSGDITMNAGTLRSTNSFTLSSDRSVIINAGGGAFDTNGQNLIVNGAMSGTGTLTTIGSGTLTFNGISTRTGKTQVNNGTLQISTANRLGVDPGDYVADQFTLNGGTLKTTSSTNFAATHGITLGSGGGTFEPASGTTFTVDSPIIGSGGLTKNGPGLMQLSEPCTFTGPTTVNYGTLALNASLPSSMVVNVGLSGTFDMWNHTQTLAGLTGEGSLLLGTGSLTIANTTNQIFSGILSGTGGNLTKSGSAAFTLSGANTYTGQTTINQGTLRLGNSNRLADMSAMSISPGAFFDLGGFSETIGKLTGSGNVLLNGGTFTVGADNNDSLFNGGISGNGGLTKTGAGTFTVNGENTYNGPTTVQEGTLFVSSSTAVPSSSSIMLDSPATLTFSNMPGQTWYFDSPIHGYGNMIKTGQGTLVLSANADYFGMTTINQGTLRIDDTLQTSGMSIWVEDNGTLEAQGVIRRGLNGNGRVVATGDLMLGGLSSMAGVWFNGTIDVGFNNVALIGRHEIGIGSATVSGGNLSTLHGLRLSNQLSGYGKIDGPFVNDGAVVGGSEPWETLDFGGPVTGAGSFAGNVQFSNIYSPGNSPAEVNLENMLLTDSSLLKMEIGGLVAGSGYDKLNISGLAHLDGLLQISLLDGFIPAPENVFDLFDGTLEGNFDHISLPALNSPLTWDIENLYATGEIIIHIAGDANRDRSVDVGDLGILAANYGMNSNARWASGDFNNDGSVDVGDLGILAANYGYQTNLAVEIPEPMTLGLLAMGGFILIHSRKRKSSFSTGPGTITNSMSR